MREKEEKMVSAPIVRTVGQFPITVRPAIIENCIFYNMFIPVSFSKTFSYWNIKKGI